MTEVETPTQRFERRKAEYLAKFGVSWDDTVTLYCNVGQAISFWSFMEATLVQICARLLGSTDERTGAILYSITNFHAWLNIIDDLFHLTPSYSEQKAAWGKISTKLRGMADTRNRVAHHTVFNGTKNPSVTISPSQFDTRAKSRKHNPLSAPEILDFIEEIYEAHSKLFDLRDSLPFELPKENSKTAESFPDRSSGPALDQQSAGGSQ